MSDEVKEYTHNLHDNILVEIVFTRPRQFTFVYDDKPWDCVT